MLYLRNGRNWTSRRSCAPHNHTPTAKISQLRNSAFQHLSPIGNVCVGTPTSHRDFAYTFLNRNTPTYTNNHYQDKMLSPEASDTTPRHRLRMIKPCRIAAAVRFGSSHSLLPNSLGRRERRPNLTGVPKGAPPCTHAGRRAWIFGERKGQG